MLYSILLQLDLQTQHGHPKAESAIRKGMNSPFLLIAAGQEIAIESGSRVTSKSKQLQQGSVNASKRDMPLLTQSPLHNHLQSIVPTPLQILQQVLILLYAGCFAF